MSTESKKSLDDVIGKVIARTVFKARGNRSEAHLSEPELAAIAAGAAYQAIMFAEPELIATCSELLTACQAVLHEVDQTYDGTSRPTIDVETLDRVRAAVAKTAGIAANLKRKS